MHKLTAAHGGSEAPIATALGLGAAWEPLLQRSGADPSDPFPWLRRFLAATEPMTGREVQVVGLRMHGLTPREIADRMGRAKVVRVQVERLCLAAAVRLATEEVGTTWLTPLDDRTGRALVRDGLPPYAAETRAVEQFTALWLEGRPMPEIRQRLGLSESHAKRLAETAPARWEGKHVAAHFGWSRENHRRRMASGHFPTPDGRDGHRNWWWPETIRSWAQTQPFQPCPVCAAQVTRLPQHLKAHSDRTV